MLEKERCKFRSLDREVEIRVNGEKMQMGSQSTGAQLTSLNIIYQYVIFYLTIRDLLYLWASVFYCLMKEQAH